VEFDEIHFRLAVANYFLHKLRDRTLLSLFHLVREFVFVTGQFVHLEKFANVLETPDDVLVGVLVECGLDAVVDADERVRIDSIDDRLQLFDLAGSADGRLADFLGSGLVLGVRNKFFALVAEFFPQVTVWNVVDFVQIFEGGLYHHLNLPAFELLFNHTDDFVFLLKVGHFVFV